SGADLTDAIFMGTIIRDTDLRGATLRECKLHDTVIRNVRLGDAIQQDIIIRGPGEEITVDDLEVAHLVDFLLHNPKVRQSIDTITLKVVLILGRFSPERKTLLDRLREEIHVRGLMPMHVECRSLGGLHHTDTVPTLAGMSRFVIADLTSPGIIPQVLEKIVPQLPSVPVQPILHADQELGDLLPHFQRYPWVLPPCHYDSLEQFAAALDRHVVEPAAGKAEELRPPSGSG
ncbi:MAG TPA: pentapeptide repeat-containing protein, partial [Longimicrobiaceae bacterium]